MKDQAKYEARAKIIKAMAHPTRLFIVDQLSERDMFVQDLTALIGSDMSTVSKHLSVLKNAGIISDVKKGSKVLYSLCMPCVLGFFSCVEKVIQTTAKEQVKLAKKK